MHKLGMAAAAEQQQGGDEGLEEMKREGLRVRVFFCYVGQWQHRPIAGSILFFFSRPIANVASVRERPFHVRYKNLNTDVASQVSLHSDNSNFWRPLSLYLQEYCPHIFVIKKHASVLFLR